MTDDKCPTCGRKILDERKSFRDWVIDFALVFLLAIWCYFIGHGVWGIDC